MSTIAVWMDVHCNLELAALSRRPSRQTSPAHSRLHRHASNANLRLHGTLAHCRDGV